MGLTIKEMARRSLETSVAKGFETARDDDWGIPRALMLVVTEVAEATEEHREQKEGWRERFASELADVVIRVGNLAAGLGIDLEAAVVAKMDKNDARPVRHGGKRY